LNDEIEKLQQSQTAGCWYGSQAAGPPQAASHATKAHMPASHIAIVASSTRRNLLVERVRIVAVDADHDIPRLQAMAYDKSPDVTPASW
jgi:hypothetical protein